MNSALYFGLTIASIFALFGYSDGNACLDMRKCVTPEYKNALKDKNFEDLCRVMNHTITCMDSKLDDCVKTGDNRISSKMTRQKERMESIYLQKCEKEETGMAKAKAQETEMPKSQAKSKGCSSEELTECIKNKPNIDAEDYCKVMISIKKCLDRLNECAGVKDALKAAREPFDKAVANCPDEGCEMPDVQRCAKLSKADSKNETCEKFGETQTCMDKLEDKCKSDFSLKAYNSEKENVDEVKESCESMGFKYPKNGSGIGFESIKSSYLFIIAASVTLAMRSHF